MEVKCGDVIRFSTALVQQIHEEPNHMSILCEVVDVQIDPYDPDGAKVLVLESWDRSTWNKKKKLQQVAAS